MLCVIIVAIEMIAAHKFTVDVFIAGRFIQNVNLVVLVDEALSHRRELCGFDEGGAVQMINGDVVAVDGDGALGVRDLFHIVKIQMGGGQTPGGGEHDLLAVKRIHSLDGTGGRDVCNGCAADAKRGIVQTENGDQRGIVVARGRNDSVGVERFIVDFFIKFTDEHMAVVDMTVGGVIIGFDSAEGRCCLCTAEDLVERENVKTAVVALFARALCDINAVAIDLDAARMAEINRAVRILQLCLAENLAVSGYNVNTGGGVIRHIAADEENVPILKVDHTLLDEIVISSGHGKFLVCVCVKAEVAEFFTGLDADQQNQDQPDEPAESGEGYLQRFIHRWVPFLFRLIIWLYQQNIIPRNDVFVNLKKRGSYVPIIEVNSQIIEIIKLKYFQKTIDKRENSCYNRSRVMTDGASAVGL